MAYQSEAELELQFTEQLNSQRYNAVEMPNYDALVERACFSISGEAGSVLYAFGSSLTSQKSDTGR